MKEFTKADFLQRCETIWNKGYARRDLFVLLERWVDSLLRYEHTMFSHGQSQGRYWTDFMRSEMERTEYGRNTLAGDADGYALVYLAAILAHPCQLCAASIDAWHTRSGFCEHTRETPTEQEG